MHMYCHLMCFPYEVVYNDDGNTIMVDDGDEGHNDDFAIMMITL